MYDIYYDNDKVIKHNNIIYSIDKIRLKTYICYQDFKELEFYINTFYKDKIKRFWLSDKKSSFHYNYNIEWGEGESFLFEFMHNSEGVNYNKDNKNYNFTIEFNPNKLKRNPIIMHILNSFNNWLLRSFDLAMDLPINILDIIVDKGKKRNYTTQSNGGDNVTYYIGTKEKDGSYKIYNKKIESNLNIPGYLTRVEITRRFEDFPIGRVAYFEYDGLFPIVFLNKYVFSFLEEKNKDKMLMAVLYAVQRGFPLSDLTRTYRSKIKNLLEAGSKIQFDSKSAGQCFKQCIYYYFVNSDTKQILM